MKTTKSTIGQLSLPPNTEDTTYGKLKLEIGPVHSLVYGSTNYPQQGSNYLLQFHATFYGESEAVALRYLLTFYPFSPSNTERALLYPNVATYDIKTNVNSMMDYISDMGALTLLVYDTSLRQSIGTVNIPLKLYLNKNLYPDRGIHTFLEVDDRFPIMKAANPKEKIGEVQIRIEGTASFERPGPQDDIRLANSMAMQEQTKQYAGGKYKPQQADYMRTVQEMKNKLSMVKQRAASANRTFGKPRAKGRNESEVRLGQEEDEQKVNESDNTQRELDEIMERGRRLQGRMMEAVEAKPETFSGTEKVWSILHGDAAEKHIIPSNIHALDFEVNDVSDSLSDISIYHKPEVAPTTTKAVEEQSENVRTENQPSRNLKDLKKMSVSLLGISFKSEDIRKRLAGHKLYILATLPVAEYGSAKIHEEEMKAHFSLEKASFTGVVDLNRTHECGLGVTDENFASLVNSSITVTLMAELEEGGIFQLFGKGELSLQKIVLAPNYRLDTLIQISYIPPKEEIAKPVQKKRTAGRAKETVKKTQAVPKSQLKKMQPISNVASLRVVVELISDFGKERPLRTTMIEGEESIKVSTLGLLLCVKIGRARDVTLRKYENDQTQIFRNLYVKYKSFPTGEPMSTSVSWGSSTPVFNHSMQYPLFLTSDIINKLGSGLLVFEVWDRHGFQMSGQGTGDEFVGLAKVSLKSFYEALKSQVVPGTFTAHHILINQYPFIIADDYVPVLNPRLGQSVGSLSITVAIGTPSQIQRLEQKSREALEKSQKAPIFADVPEPQPKETAREEMVAEEVQVEPIKEPEPEPEVKEPEKTPEETARESPEKREEEPKLEEKEEEEPKLEEKKEEEPKLKEKKEEEPKLEEKKEEEPKLEEKKEEEPKLEEKKEEELQKSIEDINEIARLLNPQQRRTEPVEEKPEEIEDIVKIYENRNVPEEEIRTKPKSPEKVTIPEPVVHRPEPPKKPTFVKHSFTVNITELANIPVLAKFVSVSQSRALNLYLRANLPFDRVPVESEAIFQVDAQTYKVAMESGYSIMIPFDKDQIEELTKGLQQDISIEICSLDPTTFLPNILGVAELPVEDLKLLILNKTDYKSKTAGVERVAFVYGTQTSDREGLIIGKLKLKLTYEVEDILLDSLSEAPSVGHIWQQERVVNREIPVNSRLMVYINKIDGIDEMRGGLKTKGAALPPPEKLNLSVHYNPIGELIHVDPKDLQEARADNEYSTDTVYCSAEPKFKKRWYIDFAVDQQVLEYLEHESATFEIRHTVPSFTCDETFGKTQERKTVLVGTAKVPLIRLLSSHSGIINEAVEIKDLYGRCFGYLHLSMNLLDAVLDIKREETKAEPIKPAVTEPEEVLDKKRTQSYPVVELEVTIESGLRLQNPLDNNIPPNTFAVAKYSVLSEEIITPTVFKSAFPAWNYSCVRTFDLSPENIEKLQSDNLKVYLYHKESLKDKETEFLIGVCEVDTTVLRTIEGSVDGYYKVCDPNKATEKGVLKVRVVPSIDLRRTITGGIIEKSPVFPSEIEEPQLDEARTLRDVYETLRQIRGEQEYERVEEEVKEEYEEPLRLTEYEQKLQKITQELSAEESEALMKRHLQNLQELELINKKLRGEPIEPEVQKSPEPAYINTQEQFVKTETQSLPEEDKELPLEVEPENQEEYKLEGNPDTKEEEYELEIRGDLDLPGKEERPTPEPQPHVTNIFEKNLLNVEQMPPTTTPEPVLPSVLSATVQDVPVPKRLSFGEKLREEEAEPKPQLIDRKKLLSTPHKKPPLPQHLSSSIKRMSGADLKERELERITRIMRASPAKEPKKYYDYSSDSDA